MNVFTGDEAAGLFLKYLELISSESDRGAVLVAASLLEAGLEDAIKKKLISVKSNKDPLFDGNSPFGTFSAKIELAYRVGVIRSDTKEMLNLFRKIRNIFAHEINICNLEEQSIKDRLLAAFQKQPDIYHEVENTIKNVCANNLHGVELEPDEFLRRHWPIRKTFNFVFALHAMALARVHLITDPIQELDAKN